MKGVPQIRKSDLAEGVVFTMIGLVCLTAVLLADTRLEGTLTFGAGWFIVLGVRSIYDYCYWRRPENRERCREILENENIEKNDELNVKVRDKAGRWAYIFGLYANCFVVFILIILGNLEIIEDDPSRVLILGGLLVVQVIAGRLFFQYFRKKY